MIITVAACDFSASEGSQRCCRWFRGWGVGSTCVAASYKKTIASKCVRWSQMECRGIRLVRYLFWVERTCGKLLRKFPRPTSPESMHGRTGMEISTQKILKRSVSSKVEGCQVEKVNFLNLSFFWFCLKGFILEPFSTAFSWRTLEEWDGEALSGLGSQEETTREFLGREKKTGSTLGWGLDLLYFHR